MFIFLIILFSSIITVLPKECLACGTCADYSIDYGLPFLKFWIPFFLIWAFIRLKLKAMFIRGKGQSSFGYELRSFLSVIIVIVLILFFSMGSVLAPFLLIFIWWLLDAVAISLRQDLQKSYITPWWQNANRIMIGCTILLIAYSYTFQFSDLNRLAKFLRYPGGPYSTVKEKVIQIGEPAIPMVVDELIIKTPRMHHGGEPSYKEGIFIIEQITGRNFSGSREELLKWWHQHNPA